MWPSLLVLPVWQYVLVCPKYGHTVTFGRAPYGPKTG